MEFSTLQKLTLLRQDLVLTLKAFPGIKKLQCFFIKSQRSRILNHKKYNINDFTVDSIVHIITTIALRDTEDEFSTLLSTQYKLEGKEKELLDNIVKYFEYFINSYKQKVSTHMRGMLATKRMEDVLSLYREHLKPRIYEKKNIGQVCTPFNLIERILDKIPHKIWKNKKARFFDPAAGMGGFLVIIYKRLMSALDDVILDSTERHEHIIKNMLYAADIDNLSVHLMKKIFGSKLNIYHGDTLSIDILKYFSVDGFDVIIGNPPFEKMQHNEKAARNGGDSLWMDFIFRSLSEWLLPQGYFGMLLPPGWRKPADDKSRSRGIWDLMSVQNTPIWIEMYDDKESKKFFDRNVSIRFDLVVLKLVYNYGFKTDIRQTNGERTYTDVKDLPFLPNGNLRYWTKLMKSKQKNTNIFYSSSIYDSRRNCISRCKTNEFKYKVIHSIHKDGSVVYLYTNKKDERGGFDVPKVLLNRFGGWNTPILDVNGDFGMSETVFAIKIKSKEEGDMLMNYFSHSMLLRYQQDMTWATSKPHIFWKLFKYFPNNFYTLNILA